MIKTINNFWFNYDKDMFEDGNIYLNIDGSNGNYMITFSEENNNYTPLKKEFNSIDFFTLTNDIIKFLNSSEYMMWKKKACNIPDFPAELSKEQIKELIDKSNSIEIKYLENKTNALEKRVEILEDSVEDLQNWRHN